jgi:hypothetical protein
MDAWPASPGLDLGYAPRLHTGQSLGLIVYGADSGGNLATVFGSGDMGQGSGALAWLTGDFTGSGKTEIAQPWNSPG